MDLTFFLSGCPENLVMAGLTVDPPGPFCYNCGSPPRNETSPWGFGGSTNEFGEALPRKCFIEGDCILSHPLAGSAGYPGDSECGFYTNFPGRLKVEIFETEESQDFVRIRDNTTSSVDLFSGRNPPGLDGRYLPAGATVEFDTNDLGQDVGWKLCLVVEE